MIKTNSFDEILNKKIGFSKFQFFSLSLLSLAMLNNGVHLLFNSLLNPIIRKENSYSSFQITLITSSFYFGTVIGSLLAGIISDKFGRKYTFIYSSLFQFLISVCFVACHTYNSNLILRFMAGVIFGINFPIINALSSEITPTKYRGIVSILVNFSLTIGKLYGCFLFYLYYENMEKGDWRSMMGHSSFTCLFAFILSFYFVEESPRFLCATEKFEKSFEILNLMGRKNNNNWVDIDIEEKKSLTNWQKENFNKIPKKTNSFFTLLNPENRRVTLCLWFIWIAGNVLMYGQMAVIFIFLIIYPI